MKQPQQTNSRKKILLWGATILTALPLLKFFPRTKKKDDSRNEMVKMFSQDGKLVEIDKKLFVSSGNKISNEELKKWIKK
jgi:hypothetical protein